jgi:hypothetical protein
MKTNLDSSNNNRQFKLDDNDKISMSELIEIFILRILKHKEYIEEYKDSIIKNIDFINMVDDLIQRIKEREINIQQTEEIIKFLSNLQMNSNKKL